MNDRDRHGLVAPKRTENQQQTKNKIELTHPSFSPLLPSFGTPNHDLARKKERKVCFMTAIPLQRRTAYRGEKRQRQFPEEKRGGRGEKNFFFRNFEEKPSKKSKVKGGGGFGRKIETDDKKVSSGCWQRRRKERQNFLQTPLSLFVVGDFSEKQKQGLFLMITSNIFLLKKGFFLSNRGLFSFHPTVG